MLKNQFYLQMPAEWTLKKTVKNAAEFVLFCFFFLSFGQNILRLSWKK